MRTDHRFPYQWTLAQAQFAKDKDKVFSCFACGGGSTMGYKLAGFDVIGCCEIDPRMMAAYKANHHPRFPFLEPIQEFKNREDLPAELYNLDILDGSPPCSSFSMAGSREEAWGKMKRFREGQAAQVLDTLFFDFIDLARRLQPKVVIAENVKGMLLGEARAYVAKIYREFDRAGYTCQHYLLNASRMGVPQRRERVFFICLRKDLACMVPQAAGSLFGEEPLLSLDFNEPPILFGEFADYKGREITSPALRKCWEARIDSDDGMGDTTLRLYGKEKYFNTRYDKPSEVPHTMTAHDACLCFERPVCHSEREVKCISTFPQDYDFQGNKPAYICGMSVPPVMMAQVASRVHEQWLSKINNNQNNTNQ